VTLLSNKEKEAKKKEDWEANPKVIMAFSKAEKIKPKTK